ncbi:uncharacterized protein RHOBADRAFT_50914 [Rhodotorula graminis WP1]|uniref:Stc1 domain-containing protein n=1 Tax=Rhodotorula graminis (strain WP1) TaxID=578459 RepID=A0A194SCJ4_RHOGW|nr:uncharacterized protein RHOBADRAFT_50914 [Rhodotorula graminis WP1]KPV78448.1 hypothetical protein RHOBADRAFT_50914 [Rhodotorula graminis WP1]
MPLARLSAEPQPKPATPPLDPRVARARSTTTLRDPKADDCSSAASVASSSSAAGPHRSSATSIKSERTVKTPYTKSHSSKPASSPLPTSIYARDNSGLVCCGTCLRFLPPRTYTANQLSAAHRAFTSARRDHRELNLREFPRCLECTAPQVVDLKCRVCGFVRPASFFSEAMRSNTHGATLEADPFDALSSDDDLDSDALSDDHLSSRSSVRGGSARSGAFRAGGTAGQRDGEDRTGRVDEAYGVRDGEGALAGRALGLEKDEDEEDDAKPSGSRPAVVYDDDDDDDEW